MLNTPGKRVRDGEFRTYQGPPIRLGIDDLKTEYAFHGNSQGDTSCTNDVKQYVASDGWLSCWFKDIDPLNQEEIDKEVERRKEWNKLYVKKLKKQGTYGKPTEGVSITLKHFPPYDDPTFIEKGNPESYRMEFIYLFKKTI